MAATVDKPVPKRASPGYDNERSATGKLVLETHADNSGTKIHQYDEQLEREVVVKVLNLELSSNERCKRLIREAQALSMLKHPGIVEVYRLASLNDGRICLVMEYVRSQSLADILEENGALTCSDATDICLQAAMALSHAHASGILHRDLKPDNILIEQNSGHRRVRLVDFGLSAIDKLIKQDQSRLTLTGIAVRSPNYMSPEQCRAEETDAHCDIYALGLIFFEMLSGRSSLAPYDVTTAMWKQVYEPLPRLVCADKKAVVPDLVQHIIDKSTAKNRNDRYPDAAAMISDLSALKASNCNLRFELASPPAKARDQTRMTLTLMAVLTACSTIGFTWLAGAHRATPRTPTLNLLSEQTSTDLLPNMIGLGSICRH